MERAKAIAALIGWMIICMAFPPVVALLAGDGAMKKVVLWGSILVLWAFFGPLVSIIAGMYAIGARAPRVKRAGAKDRQRRYERERIKRQRSKREQDDWDEQVWDKHRDETNERTERDRSLPRPRRDMPPAWRT